MLGHIAYCHQEFLDSGRPFDFETLFLPNFTLPVVLIESILLVYIFGEYRFGYVFSIFKWVWEMCRLESN